MNFIATTPMADEQRINEIPRVQLRFTDHGSQCRCGSKTAQATRWWFSMYEFVSVLQIPGMPYCLSLEDLCHCFQQLTRAPLEHQLSQASAQSVRLCIRGTEAYGLFSISGKDFAGQNNSAIMFLSKRGNRKRASPAQA